MSDLTPDQYELVELCRRRAEALHEFITMKAYLTGIDLRTSKWAKAYHPNIAPITKTRPGLPNDRNATISTDDVFFEMFTPGDVDSIQRQIAMLLEEIIWLTIQIHQIEDAIDPPLNFRF